ncbi:MAG: aminoacetone oxidase family FAD-binding enzyme, partial [Lachnospiraceae bacterium]|nr:aminoacetone oxidase family FAD-binding enzyme [Lachnospiraceae bacterium]
MGGSNRNRQVIIAGGGASGMAAAYAASLGGASVTLLEQNEKLGKKVYISGKGRCNCTNAADMETVRTAVVTNPKFLYSAFNAFSNEDLVAFLNSHGCPTKVERGNRVFPVSDHASDVIRAFERALISQGVEIRYRTKVKALRVEDNVCMGVVLTDGTTLDAGAVILATGGVSYPATGADGSGLELA